MGRSTSKNPTATNPHAGPGVENPRAVKPRNATQDRNDPNIPEFHFEEDTYCSKCGAVYRNQHWAFDESRRNVLLSTGAGKAIVCPGCKIVAERNPQGVLTLSGDYWPDHRADILNLIRNEEQRGMHTNPFERVMDIREESGSLVVETTTEKLAQRIGRSIHKAHKGELHYKWPDQDHLVRVFWERPRNHA